MNPSIYLDYAATTPTDPRVVEAMLPYFTETFGNPFSTHRFGRKTDRAVESARASLAQILNCTDTEIVFTSCGSESDNLALRGVIFAAQTAGKRARLLTARTEHHAVSHTAAQLATIAPVEVEFLPVTREGAVTPEVLETALNQPASGGVTLVSLMYANNEVGTIQPIRELAAIAHAHGALFHTDAVQGGGQLPLDVQALGVDMLSLSAHKFYGPKGVGLLYVRQGTPLLPTQTGGAQEDNRRAGTQNVPLIVGMAKALELVDLESAPKEYSRLRDRLITEIVTHIPGAALTGAEPPDRLPNHASFVFDGIDANSLLMHLDLAGIAASSGSACNTGNPEPSEVLIALGYPAEQALSSLRLTLGKDTTDAHLDRVLDVLPGAIAKLRTVLVKG
jgi:cysteine desulfurase